MKGNVICREGRFRYAVGAATVALIGACAAGHGPSRHAVLVASPRPYEQDIPLPEGFRLVDRSSEDWSGGSLRYLRHRYQGQAGKYSVRKFYREQMPLVRWTPVSDGIVQGRCSMRFERGKESCTITIADDTSGMRRRVAIDVIIAPMVR